MSVVVWWAVLAAAFWGVGRALGEPVDFASCAASAAVLAITGELGDWLRRRWAARRQRRGASALPPL
ncbi:hypothetical protein ACFXD5_04990 [Streptomyces sp. NPDC059385]|uniref:hypothetical protein n=1 Tax=Streptomyces sp. NPDC059385 TaxID=3346817 RepID=UPI0036B8721C